MKIWKRWIEKVEKHNEFLDNYVFQEEMWSPFTIFIPLLFGVILTLFVCILTFLVKNGENIFRNGIITFFISFVCCSLLCFLNWRAYNEL